MQPLLLFVLAACSGSAQPPSGEAVVEVVKSGPVTPSVDRRVGHISVEELKKLVDSGEPVRIVDVRNPDELETGMIAGSVPMPLGEYTPTAPPVSTTPKDAPIFFISGKGARSLRAATSTAESGHTVVNVEGGIEGWKAAGYPLLAPSELLTYGVDKGAR
ncbi:MAG: rhodanese-like domain-containing protein [Deltaproteobacteria bacterium]|nr:MAG: rhodanese-like domain-containing protein [Deltaproteobacteria bacterium]